MSIALTKYNLQQSQKSWLLKSKEDDQLVALTAQLKTANVKLQELSKASHTPTTTRTPHPGKQKDKQSLEAWYFENPDNLETMTKDGLKLFWCSFHKCWGNHKTIKCYNKMAHDKRVAADKTKSNKSKHKDKRTNTKALTLARALIAMTGDGEESYSDDDSS